MRKLGNAVTVPLFFCVLGWVFLRRPGIEVDEALIGNGLFERGAPLYSWHIGDAEIPVMILSYLGALKTWLYDAIFAVFPPGPVSLRLPTLIAGAITVWLFFVFLRRIAGPAAAWIGSLVLATDPSFLLNETIDFGPVAFHHLLKMGALVLLLQSRFGLAGLLLGLAMWDKAIFVWSLVGLACAAVAVFWPEVRKHLTWKSAGRMTAGFVLGAMPLIIYNVVHPLETFRSNAKLVQSDVWDKPRFVGYTMNGSVMFGFLTADDAGPKPGVPVRAGQQAAFALGAATGYPHRNLTIWAVCLSLFALPFLWRSPVRRWMLFALVYMAVTWAQMAFTNTTGGAAHHVLLLWPFHILLIACAATALRNRAVLVTLAAVLCAANLLVLDTYYVSLVRNGPSVRWTDAFPALMDTLRRSPARRVFVPDWGILETVNLMTEGSVPVTGLDEAGIRPQVFDSENDLFVSHGAPYVQSPGVMAKLEATAARLGLRKEMVTTIYDRNGRGIFEVFRYRRGG